MQIGSEYDYYPLVAQIDAIFQHLGAQFSPQTSISSHICSAVKNEDCVYAKI
jgi:hypothetical protein